MKRLITVKCKLKKNIIISYQYSAEVLFIWPFRIANIKCANKIKFIAIHSFTSFLKLSICSVLACRKEYRVEYY